MIVLQYFSLSQCVRMQHVRSVFMYVFADNCECIQQKNYISRDSRDSREIVHPGMEFPGSTRAGHTRTLISLKLTLKCTFLKYSNFSHIYTFLKIIRLSCQ